MVVSCELPYNNDARVVVLDYFRKNLLVDEVWGFEGCLLLVTLSTLHFVRVERHLPVYSLHSRLRRSVCKISSSLSVLWIDIQGSHQQSIVVNWALFNKSLIYT